MFRTSDAFLLRAKQVTGARPTERRRTIVIAGLFGAATLLAYLHTIVPRPLALIVLVAAGLLAWFLPIAIALRCYSVSLSVQVSLWIVGRLAIGDFFMVPAIVKTAFREDVVRWLRESSLFRPCALLIVTFGIGTALGVSETGTLTRYVLVNKDAGLLFLIGGLVALNIAVGRSGQTERIIKWFVTGVSVANVSSLVAAALALVGVPNDLYLTGNMRMYGWMLSPNRFGGILTVVALIEIAASTSPRIRRPWWRRANLWLLGLGLALTLSRSSWLSAAAGAGMLLTLQCALRVPRPSWNRLAVPAAWLVVPIVTILGFSRLTAMPANVAGADDYAAQLRQRLAAACRGNPSLDICVDVQISGNTPVPSKIADGVVPDLLPNPNDQRPNAATAARSLTNARGAEDRLAILGMAFREYTRSIRRMVLGIGLGTFYANSADVFGLPLIIHNTFAWFLVEMGPLGLFSVCWIWIVTARNLLRACRVEPWRDWVAPGLLAAFAGTTAFCLLNEGFYQRHVWLLFALSDRLGDRTA